MATLKTVIQKDKMRKDGTYNVKIRLTHRRETRWIATTTNVTPADLTRSGKLKNRTALLETGETINRYERALSEIGPFEMERMTAADLVEYLRKRENPDAGKEFRLDFLRWGEECAEKDKAGTRNIIKTSLNAFRRFAGSKIDINDITKNTVRGFIEFIRREPDARRTKAKRKGPGRPPADAKGEKRAWKGYCLTLRTIHERARRHFNDEDAGTILIPRRPFSVMNEYAYRTEGKRSIGRDGVQAIIDAEAVETDPKTRWALCCLILSFGLCGMNSADMTEAEAPSGGILTYRRKKTRDRRKDGALIKLKILPQLEYYARAVSGGNRLVDGYAGMTARYTNTVRYRTGIAASRAGFPPACPYALRHTWATLARSRELSLIHI